MKTLQDLNSAADQINAFGQQFCTRSYSTAAKAWRFDPNCALAGVMAFVNDDAALLVDIEFFRNDNTPENADCAENELIDFAKSLGFKVAHDANMGSGQFGAINQLALS
jgi:hypothetical protein